MNRNVFSDHAAEADSVRHHREQYQPLYEASERSDTRTFFDRISLFSEEEMRSVHLALSVIVV